jgi:hypothetical protein
MCIKIIRNKEECLYDPEIPLEEQVRGAKQVVVNYDPTGSATDTFVAQLERIVKSGINCQMNIKVNANNTLNGYRLERKIEQYSKEIDVNEIIHTLVKGQCQSDKILNEMSELCLGRENEQ